MDERVATRRVLADITEPAIKRDQAAMLGSCRCQQVWVGSAAHALIKNRVDVVASTGQDLLG